MSKRRLRIEAESEPLQSLPMGAKKQKTTRNTTKYLCVACEKNRTSGAFPDYCPSSECEHLIGTCKTCLKDWIEVQIDSNLFVPGGDDGKDFGIRCPQCPGLMRAVNVEMAATKPLYQRFDQAERKHVAETTPGWRWCLAPDCRAGKVHEKDTTPPTSKATKKLYKIDATTDICTCDECGARACVTCDRPWHQGETCGDYQARIKDKLEEEDKSIQVIRKVTKQCPHCQRNIQKNGGCPHMQCLACKNTFCWNCLSQPCQCNIGRPPQ